MINFWRLMDPEFCKEWIAAKIRVFKWNHLDLLSDKEFIKFIYNEKVGCPINLSDPKTFNEKLNWLKLYDRNPVYGKWIDKYDVKELVAEKIGEQYLIPTLGVWEHFEDIDFTKLPKQFVLKCTHDSGSTMICKDKETFDFEQAREFYNKTLGRNYYHQWREWIYKDLKPRIIAEKFMIDDNIGDLADFKFYCFDGEPKLILYASGRRRDPRFSYFDLEWNNLDIDWGYAHHDEVPQRPENLELMVQLARTLSQGFIQVRVDLYNIKGHPYFGELTFCDGGGLQRIKPEEWAYKLGGWIDLSKIKPNLC